MTRFHAGDAVRVLVTWSALSEQVGTVLDVIDQTHLGAGQLYLVRFPDRFMRYYTERELGPASSWRGVEDRHN